MDVDDDRLTEHNGKCLCDGWSVLMRMSTVTVKPLSLELSWHLTGEAGRSKINFDCIIGGMEEGRGGREGSHVGVFRRASA